MIKQLTDKLEVMIVDDESRNLETYKALMEMRGYQTTTVDDSYKAIHELAIRLFRNQPLPEVLLCDLQDRRYDLAVINTWDAKPYFHPERKMLTLHPSMAFNVYNYLKSQERDIGWLIGFTSCASDEDIETARRLKIPLIEKHETSKMFPNVSKMTYGDASLVFGENYIGILERGTE
jgi:CheY-like chemotaxis protein